MSDCCFRYRQKLNTNMDIHFLIKIDFFYPIGKNENLDKRIRLSLSVLELNN